MSGMDPIVGEDLLVQVSHRVFYSSRDQNKHHCPDVTCFGLQDEAFGVRTVFIRFEGKSADLSPPQLRHSPNEYFAKIGVLNASSCPCPYSIQHN